MSVEKLRGLMEDHLDVIQSMNIGKIAEIAEDLARRLRLGGRIHVCGCGGSAADAQHFAAELVGSFENRKRRGLAASALTTDGSVLTAVANDFSFEDVFARQILALGQPKDALIAISTSGMSRVIWRAVSAADSVSGGDLGMLIVLLSSDPGGKDLAQQCDHALLVASSVTARIQEAHGLALHLLCSEIEEAFQ